MGLYLIVSTIIFIIALISLLVGIFMLRASFRFKKNEEMALYREHLLKGVWTTSVSSIILLMFMYKFYLAHS